MADPIWPESTLPLPMRSVNIGTSGNLIRTQMDSGYIRQRKRFDAVADTYSVTWKFTDSQMAYFRLWFKWTLMNGALWFTIGLRVGDWGVTENDRTRFVGGQFQYSMDTSDMWTVTATLEVNNVAFVSQSEFSQIQELIDNGVSPDDVFSMQTQLHTLVHTVIPNNLLP